MMRWDKIIVEINTSHHPSLSSAGPSVGQCQSCLNADASFSSKQELLDLHDCPLGSVQNTPSPVDSHTGSPQTQAPGAPAPSSSSTPRWMLFFLVQPPPFLQGMIINGFINTVITSIEAALRPAQLRGGPHRQLPTIIAACVCLAFVSYFGGTGHKPRWLGWGVLIMALGSAGVRLAPLHHAALPGHPARAHRNFLHGVGATPLYTLGVTFLDENVKSSEAPVYIGIFYTAAILGPAAGYLLGGYFLNFYTEIHQTTELTPENPLWVGAWWIGFLAGGAAALLIALPILGYPRQLPGAQKYAAMRVSEAHQLKDGSHTTASDPQFGKSVKDMPRSVLMLLKNPPFLFLCLAGATEATLLAGMST
ncbi:hypothetical protein CRUP_030451, partial [Coryphaenoides rupestris]